MEALGVVGGAGRGIAVGIAFMLIPFKYHITDTQIYFGLMVNYLHARKTNSFHKHNHKKYKFMSSLKNISSFDGTFNFFWFMHDTFKVCRLQNCFKAVTPCFNWENFDGVTELMVEIKEKDLEMINMIDHDTTKIFEHKLPKIFKGEGVDLEISEEDSLSDFSHDK